MLWLTRAGDNLYRHAAGYQSLDLDAQPLDPDSTIVLASAGKFITHIAALQLVESGAITLDEPVYKHLPELESLPLLKRDKDSGEFTLHLPVNKITLRHLLLHISGLSHDESPLLSEYFAAGGVGVQTAEDAPYIVKHFSMPLEFEPGEGFAYGHSIHWTQLLVSRMSSGKFMAHMQEHVFNKLGLTSSTYNPRGVNEIWTKRLRMVERESGGNLVHNDDAAQGLTCSMSDIGAILSDLVSPSPRLLKQEEHIALLFNGQLKHASPASADLHGDPENYGFCAGATTQLSPPALNWSAAGLVIEEQLSFSGMPSGTVTWEGMPNVLWAMHRTKGIGMFFATQLIPVGDKAANTLAAKFMKDAWSKFG